MIGGSYFVDDPTPDILSESLLRHMEQAWVLFAERRGKHGLGVLVELVSGARMTRHRALVGGSYCSVTNTIVCGSGGVLMLLHEECHALQKKAGADVKFF